MRTVIYVRTSAASTIDSFGLAVQETQCRDFATRHGFDIVRVFTDDGISGARMDRPGLTSSLLAARDGDADAIVVARLDRLARQLTVQEAVLTEVWRYGGEVYAADYGQIKRDDPDDPMRTFVRQVMGAVAEFERALVSKRLRDGRRAKKALGGKAEGSYPFGWAKDGPVQREQQVLARIRDLRAEGLIWQQVADVLNEEGLRPRSVDKWSGRNVAKVMATQQKVGA